MKWISIEDKLPEKYKYVLGYGSESTLHGQNYDQVKLDKNGDWIAISNYTHLRVTHWMPLPEPPNIKEKL